MNQAVDDLLAGASGPPDDGTPFVRNGRYQLLHPTTGEPTTAQRASNFAKVLQDTYSIEKWSMRQVLLGAALRPDITAQTIAAGGSDARKLDDLAAAAKEAAGASSAANLGTAMHDILEQVDDGRDVAATPAIAADIDAYRRALVAHDLESLTAERVIYNEALGVAGRFDRVYRHGDTHRIGDLKGLAIETPIPTPWGWTTMGELQVGDEVFDRDGQVCTVTEKSDRRWVDCYRIRFDDGTDIVADGEHRWLVTSGERPYAYVDQVLTTVEIAETLRGDRGQRQHRVRNAGPLELPDAVLPIHPYVLGAWLGDGHRNQGTITKPLPELWDAIEACGYELGVEQVDKRTDCTTRTVLGLRTLLREEDLLGNKHIPAEYLRGSTEQRLALLQGLMDTDGCWNIARKQAVFTNTDKSLALGVFELAASLGWRPHFAEVERTGYGVTVTAYDIAFTPHTLNPFRARAEKVAEHLGGTARCRRRLIAAVEAVPSVATQCITVDSPTSTYLAGHPMVPTHNTGKFLAWDSFAIQLAIYARAEWVWDAEAKRWVEHSGIDAATALVVHLPVGTATCDVWTVDIAAGWEACTLTNQVKDYRKRRDLAAKLAPAEGSSPAGRDGVGEAPTVAATAVDELPGPTPQQIDAWVTECNAILRDRLAVAIEALDGVLPIQHRWPEQVRRFRDGGPRSIAGVRLVHTFVNALESHLGWPFGPALPPEPVGEPEHPEFMDDVPVGAPPGPGMRAVELLAPWHRDEQRALVLTATNGTPVEPARLHDTHVAAIEALLAGLDGGVLRLDYPNEVGTPLGIAIEVGAADAALLRRFDGSKAAVLDAARHAAKPLGRATPRSAAAASADPVLVAALACGHPSTNPPSEAP